MRLTDHHNFRRAYVRSLFVEGALNPIDRLAISPDARACALERGVPDELADVDFRHVIQHNIVPLIAKIVPCLGLHLKPLAFAGKPN
jgi:hypothetical protein